MTSWLARAVRQACRRPTPRPARRCSRAQAQRPVRARRRGTRVRHHCFTRPLTGSHRPKRCLLHAPYEDRSQQRRSRQREQRTRPWTVAAPLEREHDRERRESFEACEPRERAADAQQPMAADARFCGISGLGCGWPRASLAQTHARQTHAEARSRGRPAPWPACPGTRIPRDPRAWPARRRCAAAACDTRARRPRQARRASSPADHVQASV